MKIKVKRVAKKPTYTIGHLYIDDKYFCDTIEDRDRGLTQKMSIDQIKSIKVKNETAIPTGTYNVLLNVKSPKFGSRQFYIDTCKGCVPRIDNVPGFEGVLIHCGKTDKDSSGCILVGENKVVGKVINSQKTFTKLIQHLKNQNKVTITIE